MIYVFGFCMGLIISTVLSELLDYIINGKPNAPMPMAYRVIQGIAVGVMFL